MKSIIIALVTVMCFGGGIVFGEGRQEPIPPEQIEAEIAYLEGTVLVNGDAVEIGDTLEIGSTVETKENSACEIIFGRGNIFRIEPETITTISIDGAKREIDLQSGAIDAVFGKLSSLGGADREFTISTPTIVAGVRGTVFYVKIEDPDTTYFCTCHGKIHQQAPGADIDKTVTSYHHKAYRYTKEVSEVEAVQADLLYHDDEAMEEIADKAGVVIPWNILRRNYDEK